MTVKKSYWQVGYPIDGQWQFDDHEHDDAEKAIVSVTFKTARATYSTLEDNGSYSVHDVSDGAPIACVRKVTAQKDTVPGDVPVGTLGPLRRWHGLTWVGWVNYLVLRWFLFRIEYTVEQDNTISKWKLRFWPTWRW